MKNELLVVGLSHHTAPVDLRERLAVKKGGLGDELSTMMATGAFQEAVLVSTCNRVELYATTGDADVGARVAREHLDARVAPDTVTDSLYERRGPEAVRHTFRVAASLDSMVVGEPQILGQVKQAYETATKQGTVGALLGRCFTRAFAVAKRVRNETGIAEGMVSVSSIACELARKIFGDLAKRRVLLLGAGEMGEAAARALSATGAKLVVMNRSPDKAQRVAAECGGVARAYEQLVGELVKADVVITSTSSPRFVLTRDTMRQVVKARRRRPLFVIDIAVPRDVDPRVGDMENIFVYDVDDLSQVAEQNREARRREADAAERLISTEVVEFEHWRRALDLTPTIVALRAKVRAVLDAELGRTTPRLANLEEADHAALERMLNAMVNKLLHPAIVELKHGVDEPDGAVLIEATRRLFQLPVHEADAPEPNAPARAMELVRAGEGEVQ